MGSAPATLMANLFVYSYENKWLLDTKKRYLPKAGLLSNAFRFIDGFRAINYHLKEYIFFRVRTQKGKYFTY